MQDRNDAELPPLELEVSDGGKRRIVRLRGSRAVVGRSEDADIPIADRRVSRFHAVVHRRPDFVYVVDLGSRNGTLVDGRRVEAAPLFRGSEVRMGDARLRIAAGAPPPFEDPDAARARLIAELARDGAHLSRLVRATRDVVEAPDVREVLRRLLDAFLELSGAERAFVVLVDPTGRLETEAARHVRGEPVHDADVAVSRSIAQKVLEEGRPLLTVNAREDERFRRVQSIANLGLRSVLCLPLKEGRRNVGVVYLDDRLESGVFGPADVERLAPLADVAAIAVSRARVLADLRRTNRALEAARKRLLGRNEELLRAVDDREAELAQVRARIGDASDPMVRFETVGILGRSRALRRACRLLEKLAASPFPALLEGESGTGKELFARAMHRLGPRASGPFVVESCGALPDTLLESELFGSVRGAFTGAVDRRGLLERAHGGTLFLDEVGELAPSVQVKLLRFLEEGEVRPLGGDRPVRVDVRVVAATHRDLRRLVAEGKFRSDLYYRLAVLTLRLPPLREREGDVRFLVERFLERAAASAGRKPPSVSDEAMARLEAYPWPGNVRELRNEVYRLVTVCEGDLVEVRHLSPPVAAGLPGVPVGEGGTPPGEALAETERREIERALALEGGNRTRAARRLGISRFALRRKMEKHGIRIPAGGDTSCGRSGSSSS